MKTELKDKARELRLQGISVNKIATNLKVARSTVSLWVRDIALSSDQKSDLLSRSSAQVQKSKAFLNKRLNYQNIGRKRVYTENQLYLAGCMLYWGEGSKEINSVKLVNSEAAMLVLFKEFLSTFFNVTNDKFLLTINCYTDLHSLEEIEAYWLDKLGLGKDNLRKGQVNYFPKSSTNCKPGKLEWGTATIIVYRTDIVQEIYGAIQEFGKFTNKNWLG